MSQIAWWTLDGHLKDSIGDNNMVITGNGITIDNTGKIGKCYKATRVKEYLKSTKTYKLMGSQSYCCWFKVFSDNDVWGSLISTYNHDERTGLATVINKNDNGFKINITAGYNNEYSNNMCQVQGDWLQFDTWYHMAMVYDADEQYFKIFINGELYARSTSIANKIRFADNTNIYLLSWDQTKRYYASMKINDVRLFNHALSLKEIKEISKAKILHVDFSEEFINSQAIINTNKKLLNWQASNLSVELVNNMVSPDGGQVYKLTKSNDNQANLLRDSGPDVSSDDNAPVKFGRYYTFYLWCRKGNVEKNIVIDISDYIYTGGTTKLIDEWQLIKVSGRLNDSGYAFTDIMLSGFNPGEYCYISQPQTIEGTSTPRIIDPINNDRATKYKYNGIIIDKSGFNNNMTYGSNSPVKWVNDSAIGTGSIYFDNPLAMSYTAKGYDSQCIRSKKPVYIPSQFTLSYWCKGDSDLTKYRNHNIYAVGWLGKICSCEGQLNTSGQGITSNRMGLIYYVDSSTYRTSTFNKSLHDGQWHHVVIKCDYIAKKFSFFKDGELVANVNVSTDIMYINTFESFVIGAAWSSGYGPWWGYLADIRVYATCLSDDDCVALYNQKASLSKNGRLSCSAFNESKYLSSNRLDYTGWKLGTTGSQSKTQKDDTRTGWFGQISGDDLNEIVLRKNPKNVDDIVWRGVRKDNSDTTNADGGFNTGSFRIDKNSIYRVSIWIKRPYIDSSANWYLGVYAYDDNGNNLPMEVSSGNNTNNFYQFASTNVYNNDWFLVVGYVLSNNIADNIFKDTTNYLTRIYNSKGEQLTYSANKCKFPNNATKLVFRSYLYYSASRETEQYFYRPRVDKIDGTEPSIRQLINLEECDNIYKSNMNGVDKNSVFTEEEFSEVGNMDLISAYYPLMEDFRDYSGNKFHLSEATFSSTVTDSVKLTENGAEFTELGKYLYHGTDNNLLDFSNTFTLAFNIKLTGNITNVNSTMNRVTLFEKDLYMKDFSINLQQYNNDINIQLYVGNGSGYDSRVVTIGNITDFTNNFVNIIICKIPSKLTVYVNGVKKETNISQVTPVHGSGPFRIGSGYCGTAGCIMNHIKVFKRILSEQEALTEYKWYLNQAKLITNRENRLYTNELIED